MHFQVASKIVCMSWTSDGMLLAMGLYDGSISVRDKAGTEKHKFSASSSPVWSIAWSPQVSSSREAQCCFQANLMTALHVTALVVQQLKLGAPPEKWHADAMSSSSTSLFSSSMFTIPSVSSSPPQQHPAASASALHAHAAPAALCCALQDQSVLAAGCLDGQLRFFSSTGQPKLKERSMEGDPLSLAYFNSDYLLAAGTDK